MATDEEILRLWGTLPKTEKSDEAIIRLYRIAEDAGRQAGLSAMEEELLSDATIKASTEAFRWGKRSKASTITLRAVMREAARIAKEKAGNRN
jgi:hypothetical protein